MERRRILQMLLTALAIALVIVGGSLTLSVRQEKSAAHANDEQSALQTTVTETGYLLKITDDNVLGLYRIGSSTPYRILDMPIALLSDYDRAQLEQGITAETEAELQRLIEDYTS